MISSKFYFRGGYCEDNCVSVRNNRNHRKMAFCDGDENIKLNISLMFFLVEHGKRKILIDTGCNTMPGFELSQFEYPVNVLENYGVQRTDITDVIITHAHHDHIDAVGSYPQATVHIHKNELEISGKYLANSKYVTTFDKSESIDDILEIKYIGGHSPGSSIVLIKCGGDTYVMCGDECYTHRNLLENKPTSSSFSPVKSACFVNEYRKEKYIPVLFHDPELVTETGARILYAD